MLRLRKRHCFRFGFVGYGCGFAQRAHAGAQCACFGRDRNGPYVFHVGRRERCRWRKTVIRPCDSDPKTRGCKSSCRGRSSDSSRPQRLPGRRRPVAKSVAGLSFSERGLTAASPVPDSHRIPYCPVRPADGNHDDAKIVFFRFVGAFRVQKNAKKNPDPPDAGSGT